MANHGFATRKKHMTAQQVHEAVEEIVARRFKGKLTIEANLNLDKDKDGMLAEWNFFFDDNKTDFAFSAWLRHPRKLEFRHPHGSWPWYGQMILSEELGQKFSCTMSDEGVPERWKPNPMEYPTFRSWQERDFRYLPSTVRPTLQATNLFVRREVPNKLGYL